MLHNVSIHSAMSSSGSLTPLDHANTLIRYGIQQTCPEAFGIVELPAARAQVRPFIAPLLECQTREGKRFDHLHGSASQVSKRSGAPDLVSRAARCCYSFLSGQQKRTHVDSDAVEPAAHGAVSNARSCKRAKVR